MESSSRGSTGQAIRNHRIAVLILAYNEEELIKQAVQQWAPLPVLVLRSLTPWNGSPAELDDTPNIARDAGAEVVEGHWHSEHDQRNYGLGILSDYDYVITVDADEFFENPDDVVTFVDEYSGEFFGAFRVTKMDTYWFDLDHVLYPGHKTSAIVAVDPKQVVFNDKRSAYPVFLHAPFIQTLPIVPVTMHNLSWIGSDARLLAKIQAFSHASEISDDWFDSVWKGWTPDKTEMEVQPYGPPMTVVHRSAPTNIKQMFN